MRNRTRVIDTKVATRGNPLNSFKSMSASFWESSYPGSCECNHVVYPLFNGERFDTVGLLQSTTNWPSLNLQCESAVTGHINANAGQLNWNKIPSSTQAGLIQILAEIDDTIALFTARFWQNLSYGSWTWGVMPFVQDLCAVATAVSNLSKNLNDFSYEDTYQSSKEYLIYEDYQLSVYCTVDTVFRLTGRGNSEYAPPINRALDWLGFHPDLATAWDLIPLSFVVDYLLPIGDYLQSFRQGGWVKALYFYGWFTTNSNLQLRMAYKPPFYGDETWTKGTSFRRMLYSDVLTPKEPGFPGGTLTLQIPSFQQMFNMFYIAASRRK